MEEAEQPFLDALGLSPVAALGRVIECDVVPRHDVADAWDNAMRTHQQHHVDEQLRAREDAEIRQVLCLHDNFAETVHDATAVLESGDSAFGRKLDDGARSQFYFQGRRDVIGDDWQTDLAFDGPEVGDNLRLARDMIVRRGYHDPIDARLLRVQTL